LYELLTGKLPFEGQSTFDFLMARLTDPPAPLLKVNPNAPAIFGPILDQALAQNPTERYQTMNEFSCVLKEAQRQLNLQPIAPVASPVPRIRLTVKPGGQEILASGPANLTIGRAYKDQAPQIDLGPYGGSQAGVSRHHACLVYQNNQWLLEDLASTNGTFVNGTKIAPHQPAALKTGDLIRCGQLELRFTPE
jgi:hypothetical protein